MATAVLRSHDVLDNRMHIDAFTPSPSKPRRRRHPKPVASTSPPPKMAAVASPAPKPAVVASPARKPAVVASPVPKAAAASRRSPPARPARKQSSPAKEKPKQRIVMEEPAVVASPVPKAAAASRLSPPARPARKQSSPAKEKPKQRIVMEEVRILKRGEEPPAPTPSPSAASTPAPAVAQVAPVEQRVLCTTSRIGPQEPAVVPTKIVTVANSPVYAGPAFSAAAPEPSSLPFPAFFLRRAEVEATLGLRCLLRIGELS